MSEPYIDPFTGRVDDLEWLRWTFELGNELAGDSALFVCATRGLDVPPWVAQHAALTQMKLRLGRGSKKRGRAANPIARRRQDQIDNARYETVMEIRERRPVIRRDIEELRRFKGIPAQRRRKELEQVLKGLGTSDLDAFECAFEELRGTDAEAPSSAAIRRSFRKVQRALRSPETAAPYHLLDYDFERALGTHVDTIGPVNSDNLEP